MFFHQPIERFHRWFLQHLLEYLRCPAVTDEDAMVAGDRSIKPQAVADDIGIRNGWQLLVAANQYVATDNHRVQPLRCHRHDAFIERQLQRQQVLRQPLSTLPTKHGDWCQDLA